MSDPADLWFRAAAIDPGIVQPHNRREQRLADHWRAYGIREALSELGHQPPPKEQQ